MTENNSFFEISIFHWILTENVVIHSALKKEAISPNHEEQGNLLLLSPILELVFNDCKKELLSFFENPAAALSAANTKDVGSSGNGDDSESALIGTLRRFLSRISVCLLHDDDADILSKYTFPYCFSLMAKCTEILALSNKQCVDQNMPLHQKAFIVDIFRYKMGELLSPMLTGIWSLDLSLTLCSNILPPIHRFIRTLSEFMADLPDCKRAEQQFIRSEFVTNTVKQDVVTESVHPVPRGLTTKTVSKLSVFEMFENAGNFWKMLEVFGNFTCC